MKPAAPIVWGYAVVIFELCMNMTDEYADEDEVGYSLCNLLQVLRSSNPSRRTIPLITDGDDAPLRKPPPILAIESDKTLHAGQLCPRKE